MTNSKDIVTTRNTHPYDSEKEEKVGKKQETHSLLINNSHHSIRNVRISPILKRKHTCKNALV